jgi:hypothetical protein
MATTPIDTGKVKDRRALHFNTLEEMWADVQRIAAAERAGKLRRTGNWSAGQTLGHLAAWADFAFDGYPPDMKVPWFIKLFLKLRKKQFLRGPLPAGVKIPRVEGGTKGIEPLSLDEGLARLRRAMDRLEASPPGTANVIFGPLTHEQWQALHLRHGELHLSFLHPE